MTAEIETLPLLLAAGWQGCSPPPAVPPPAAGAGATTPQQRSLPADADAVTPLGWQGKTPSHEAFDIEGATPCLHCKGTATSLLQPCSSAGSMRACRADGSLVASTHPSGCPWGMTGALLLADMLGLGALAMPGEGQWGSATYVSDH